MIAALASVFHWLAFHSNLIVICYGTNMLCSSVVSLVLIKTFIVFTAAENRTILTVPKAGVSWSWSKSGTGASKWSKQSSPERYIPCDNDPKIAWLRSNVFQVINDAKRVDITVEYAVSNCTELPGYKNCKANLKFFVHKAAVEDKSYDIFGYVGPNPATKPELFELFGTTNPKVLTVGSITKPENTETYSFNTNPAKSYHYLAIQYTGGCYALFGISISYSVCPDLALPLSLVKLPQTTSPANGSIQVSGSCADYAQPMAKNMTLYGHCQADGEWSTNMYSGECWCDAGYGKYSVVSGHGVKCNECPAKTYQNTPSNSKCKDCPMNSTQDTNRTKCKCQSRFYRTEKESVFDNCTAQPSAPQELVISSYDATLMTIKWSPPLDLGGRSDVYYEVECKQCKEKGQDCTTDCTGAVITHTTSTTRMATVKHLSAYTYYQIKVFAKNGVTNEAQKNNEPAKYAILVKRTKESIPGIPVVTIEVLNSTSVLLRWTLEEKNGEITYYQVTYYPDGEESKKKVLKTTKNRVTIAGLIEENKYIFQVEASTSVGLGKPSNTTQIIALPNKGGQEGDASQELVLSVAIGVTALVVIVVVIILAVCLYKRRHNRAESKLHLAMTPDLIPLDGHRMYIDPSTYGSPMEALMSNAEEIDFHKLKLDKYIGGGEFADVYKGILTKGVETEIVAVKRLKPKSSTKNKEDFILEASIMGQFKHPNVIEMKGVVTRSPDSPMVIITEFMENGSLDHYLKLRDGQLTVLQLVGMARGVADGMAYLCKMNFIHRDLAARNILVADNMSSKVSDFGLSRELDNSEDNPNSEYQTQGGKIPVRWTAPEAIRYRKFSSASDVWSFGILLWEIMSFAERPYWDWDNFEVMQRVDTGYRLPAPMNCPKAVHNVMLDCWEDKKIKRPKFPDIVQRLEDMIRSPETMSDDQVSSRFSKVASQANFGEVSSVEEWLVQINMRQYTDNFVNAGLSELRQITTIGEDDLKRIGVKLVGHRNKINKSIIAMKTHFESMNNGNETKA